MHKNMFSLDTTPWEQWLEHTKEAVKQMDMLMESKYAVTIREDTTPLVPLKTGKLIGSFITDLSSTFPVTEMTFGYSAYDEKSGFNYAEYQHDIIKTHQHPIQGVQFYLRKGIYHAQETVFTEIEEDYLSCFHI